MVCRPSSAPDTLPGVCGPWFTSSAGEKAFDIPATTLNVYARGDAPWPSGVKPRVQRRKMRGPWRGLRTVQLFHRDTLEAIKATRRQCGKFTGILRGSDGDWFTPVAGEGSFGIPAETLLSYLRGRSPWPARVNPRVQKRKIVGQGGASRHLVHRETLEALVAIRRRTWTGVFNEADGDWFTVVAASKGFGIPKPTLFAYCSGRCPWPRGIKPRVQRRKIIGKGRRVRTIIHRETLEALVAFRRESAKSAGVLSELDGDWFLRVAGAQRFGIPEGTLRAYLQGRLPWPSGVKPRVRRRGVAAHSGKDAWLIHRETLEALVAVRGGNRRAGRMPAVVETVGDDRRGPEGARANGDTPDQAVDQGAAPVASGAAGNGNPVDPPKPKARKGGRPPKWDAAVRWYREAKRGNPKLKFPRAAEDYARLFPDREHPTPEQLKNALKHRRCNGRKPTPDSPVPERQKG